MIAALLLVATVLVSALVVRIGAVAFEMTGLDRDKAHFQALSCFSGTGFTTREAELITGHHYRRRTDDFRQRGLGDSDHDIGGVGKGWGDALAQERRTDLLGCGLGYTFAQAAMDRG
jgi:hypothetical protein